MDIWTLQLVFIFLIGLAIGSFLNVVALRLLAEESIVSPGSHCRACQTPLAWHDNIPVLSWVVLGGKCRSCKAGVSVQYPLVELITGLLFAAVFYRYGWTWETLFYLPLVASLVVLTVTDLREQYIYDINSVGLIPLGLLYHVFNLGNHAYVWSAQWGPLSIGLHAGMISALIAIIGVFLIFSLLSLISRWLLGVEGFGGGDVKLMMGLGAYFGWEKLLLIFIASFLVQAVVSLPVILTQWIKAKDWGSMGYGLLALAGAFIPYFSAGWGLPVNVQMIISLVFLIASVYALWQLLRRARERESLTYLPFGPAIVVSALAVLLFDLPGLFH